MQMEKVESCGSPWRVAPMYIFAYQNNTMLSSRPINQEALTPRNKFHTFASSFMIKCLKGFFFLYLNSQRREGDL